MCIHGKNLKPSSCYYKVLINFSGTSRYFSLSNTIHLIIVTEQQVIRMPLSSLRNVTIVLRLRLSYKGSCNIRQCQYCSQQNHCNDDKLLVANTLRQRSLKCQWFTLTIHTDLKITEKKPPPLQLSLNFQSYLTVPFSFNQTNWARTGNHSHHPLCISISFNKTNRTRTVNHSHHPLCISLLSVSVNFIQPNQHNEDY